MAENGCPTKGTGSPPTSGVTADGLVYLGVSNIDDCIDAQHDQPVSLLGAEDGEGESGNDEVEVERDLLQHALAQRLDGSLAPGAEQQKRNWTLGLFFTFIVVLIWVGASFLIQNIEGKLEAPFFLTYMATNLFMCLLPFAYANGAIHRVLENDKAISGNTGLGDPDRPSMRYIFYGACWISPFWFIANWTYNVGLAYTSVTSSTIISGMSVVFTLGFGSFLGLERPTRGKVFGVFACIAGTALVALADGEDTPSESPTDVSSDEFRAIGGDIASLIGALFYSGYTLLIEKFFVGGDDRVDMALVFGLIGLVNFIVVTPLVFVLHFSSLESLADLTWPLLGWIVINGLVNNVVSDYLFARAVLLTTPTTVSVGLSMTIPLATVTDAIVATSFPPLPTVLGAVFVTGGFLAVTLAGGKKPAKE